MSDNLHAALSYAATGLAVFPLIVRSKEPAVARGFKACTTNPETVRRFCASPIETSASQPVRSLASGCSMSTAATVQLL
jgi:Bifunctional DNA primase/polymerase, N-terminal